MDVSVRYLNVCVRPSVQAGPGRKITKTVHKFLHSVFVAFRTVIYCLLTWSVTSGRGEYIFWINHSNEWVSKNRVFSCDSSIGQCPSVRPSVLKCDEVATKV